MQCSKYQEHITVVSAGKECGQMKESWIKAWILEKMQFILAGLRCDG
ncbi:MAG: hypothetical protein OSA45_03820 [Halioglobus sp.]|jgi:hypothetical protein|nr:hypothetical protein [Halioglobus sp.]